MINERFRSDWNGYEPLKRFLFLLFDVGSTLTGRSDMHQTDHAVWVRVPFKAAASEQRGV